MPLPDVPGERAAPLDPGLQAKYEKRSAAADEWDAEVFNEAAGRPLARLAALLEDPATLDAAALEGLAAADFLCGALRPSSLAVVFSDSAFTVYRPAGDGPGSTQVHGGREGFAQALLALLEPLRGGSDAQAAIEVKLKVTTAALEHDAVVTTILLYAGASTPRGQVQVNARWRARWGWDAEQRPLPELASIELVSFEEIHQPRLEGPLFEDCTKSVLGANAAWEEQLRPGLEHWSATLDAELGVSIIGHQGLAVGDVNGDGLDDLFVCQPGGLPNRLFVQNSDGSATDVSAAAGVDHLDHTRSALILDFDGDGDEDLAVATDPNLIFLDNQGDGRFTLAAGIEARSVTSLSAADFDTDGDLDVYACGYMLPDREERAPVPYHDANNGRENLLFRNDGEWSFVEVSRQVGLDQNNRRFSFAAAWEDYDNDGDPDLYVSNDYGRNNLYRNDAGHFKDVAAEAAVEDIAAGMGVSWADYDGDGWMDLYVSNMFSSAGGRVTYQRQFRPDLDSATREAYQRHARGNSLFRNLGDGTFRDASLEAGVSMGRWAWGAKFVDLNNDGLEDLYVPNGFVTGDDPQDL
jgi:hypothetical protein